MRFAAALTGVAFANVLVFVQLGIMNSMATAVLHPYSFFSADVMISAADANGLTDGGNVARQWLLQAMADPDVTDGMGRFIGNVPWDRADVDIGFTTEASVGDDAVVLKAAALILLVVFGVKAAILPLHLWLPSTYAAASAPVAALFAVMTKVGVYSILRVHGVIFGADAGASALTVEPWLLPLALGTSVLAVFGMLAAHTLPRMVAYMTVASVGTILAALGLFSEAAWSAARGVLASVAQAPPAGWAHFSPQEEATLTGFARLYDRHLREEDGLVYPAAQAGLSPQALQAMSADMMRRRGLEPA